MSLAAISLLVLLAVVLVSCVAEVNVGLLGFALAWILGVYVAPQFGDEFSTKAFGAKGVVAGFPADLALTLMGVSLLFTEAQVNGTLDLVARRGVQLCQGKAALVPVMFFVLAAALSALGAGNIAAAALIAPAALAAGDKAGVPPLLMVLMVAHGSIAGAMSPLSPMGIITGNNLEKIGITSYLSHTLGLNIAVNAGVAVLGYVMFGGLKLWRQPPIVDESVVGQPSATAPPSTFSHKHVITLLAIALVFSGVIFFEIHLGLAAMTASAVIIMLRAADEKESVRRLPWGVVLLIAGMSTLVSLVERFGGIRLLAELLAANTPASVASGIMAFTTGVLSLFSSTSGVILPTFLPMIDDLVAKMHGPTALQLATSVVIGGNLVDVSPVSTIGALCLAAAPATCDRRRLYRQMLFWGTSMAVVAAVVCQLLP